MTACRIRHGPSAEWLLWLLLWLLQVDDAEAKWHKHQDYKKAMAPEAMSN